MSLFALVGEIQFVNHGQLEGMVWTFFNKNAIESNQAYSGISLFA